MLRISCSCLTLAFHSLRTQVKWGADYLINAHVEDYVFMGSMGNQTEGERCSLPSLSRWLSPIPGPPQRSGARL